MIISYNFLYFSLQTSNFETFKFFEDKMRKSVAEFLPSAIVKDLKIIPASMANEAGIVGAASLCMKL